MKKKSIIKIIYFIILYILVPFITAELLYTIAPQADYTVLLNICRIMFIVTYLIYTVLKNKLSFNNNLAANIIFFSILYFLSVILLLILV